MGLINVSRELERFGLADDPAQRSDGRVPAKIMLTFAVSSDHGVFDVPLSNRTNRLYGADRTAGRLATANTGTGSGSFIERTYNRPS
jgi:hypothetical protein